MLALERFAPGLRHKLPFHILDLVFAASCKVSCLL